MLCFSRSNPRVHKSQSNDSVPVYMDVSLYSPCLSKVLPLCNELRYIVVLPFRIVLMDFTKPEIELKVTKSK